MSLDIQPSILNNQPSTINQLVLPIGINLENGGRTLQPDTASVAYDVTTGIVFYGSGSTWIPFESGPPIPSPTNTKIIYVNKGGNDSNNGSILAPFLTISAAMASVIPANGPYEIQVGPGQYSDNFSIKPFVIIIGCDLTILTGIVDLNDPSWASGGVSGILQLALVSGMTVDFTTQSITNSTFFLDSVSCGNLNVIGFDDSNMMIIRGGVFLGTYTQTGQIVYAGSPNLTNMVSITVTSSMICSTTLTLESGGSLSSLTVSNTGSTFPVQVSLISFCIIDTVIASGTVCNVSYTSGTLPLTGITLSGGATSTLLTEGGASPVTLTGNVVGSGLGTVPTLLAATINLPSSTGTEILSFDSSQTQVELILLNNAPITATFDKVHLRFQNVSNYGYYFSYDYQDLTPQGTFQLLSYNGVSTQEIFLVDALAPSFTFNVPVIMGEDLSMGNREIHNLNVSGSPASEDAVNVLYVNSLLNSTTFTTDSGIATITSGNINFECINIAGSSVSFSASGSTINLNASDAINNTMFGKSAGNASITGTSNSGFGVDVLNSLTSGINNTAFGLLALNSCTSGNFNTAVGVQALQNNSGGSFNTGIGLAALQNNTASNNTAVGSGSLQNNTSGINNTCLGTNSGSNYTSSESYNICIGNPGIVGESSAIHIGQTSGAAQALSCFIGGISGVSVTGSAVIVNASGQLGVTVSSKRYKEDIQPMGNWSNSLMKLKPKRFKYRGEFVAIGEDSNKYYSGMIAEDVLQHRPDLVEFNNRGEILTIKYHDLVPELLNEIQIHEKDLSTQREVIYDLMTRIERLETK